MMAELVFEFFLVACNQVSRESNKQLATVWTCFLAIDWSGLLLNCRFLFRDKSFDWLVSVEVGCAVPDVTEVLWHERLVVGCRLSSFDVELEVVAKAAALSEIDAGFDGEWMVGVAEDRTEDVDVDFVEKVDDAQQFVLGEGIFRADVDNSQNSSLETFHLGYLAEVG